MTFGKNMHLKIVRLATVAFVLLIEGCATTPAPRVQEDRSPRAVYLASPDYPFELKKAGITGRAVVEFVISTSGDVIEAHAVEATHPLFAKAAVEAVLRCKYKPGIRNGVPVNTKVQVPLSFDLK